MSGRILIADELATNRIVLKVKLTVSCYDVIQVENSAHVEAQAKHTQPDLIILGKSGTHCVLTLCRDLKANPALKNTPVIVVAEPGDTKARLEALRAGADDVFTKPLDDAALMAMVRSLIRARGSYDEIARRRELSREFGCAEEATPFEERARVVLIAPDAQTGVEWHLHLTANLNHDIVTLTQSEALEDLSADTPVPDAFVLGSTLSETSDGLQLVSELRSRLATRHAIIVVQDCGESPSPGSMALDLGANAVLRPGFDAEELALRLKRLLSNKAEIDALRKSFDTNLALAMLDPLTGLHNRRYAQSYLDRLEREANDNGRSFAIMVLDLDRFKSVNDRFGHVVGDQVLVEVSKRLKSNLRDMDLLARLGGEEFLVALPGTTHKQAQQMAERLRLAIADTPIWSETLQKDIAVTLSIGVAVSKLGRRGVASAHELMQSADQALYVSKSDGRNQVTFVPNAA